MNFKGLLLILSLVAVGGCSSISLTEQGKKIRIVGNHDVAGCKVIGTTTATVTDKVIGLQRKEPVIRDDLETLARNAAVNMGGDTIVPEGKLKKGKQTFKVYKCKGR